VTAYQDFSAYDFEPSANGVVGEPIDIKPKLADPEAFPLDKMPARLAAAIRAIVDIVQVPVPIAAQSVLGACALVAQSRLNVEMPTREVVPCSLNLITIAGSGERKSSADKRALGPIYEHEKQLRQAYEPQQQRYLLDKAAYDASLAAAKRGAKNRDQVRQNMEECGQPPIPPLMPMLLVEEPTIEGITKLLDEAYPSVGLFSDEGSRMLGGYSMQEEKQAGTGGALSQLWDGKPIKRVRAGDIAKFLDGRRMSVHLMIQPGVASKFFGNKALRDQGMLARMLVAAPESNKGTRFWSDPSAESWAAMDAYDTRLGGLLRAAFSRMNPETKQLEFSTVSLQAEARELWIGYSDRLEKEQALGGSLAPVSDLASKMSQHALRLAAVISYFEGGESVAERGISSAAMTIGIALGDYYLKEALRLFNAGSVSDDAENANALIDFIRNEKLETVGRRWLSRNVTPSHIRPAETFGRAIDLLVTHGHLHPVQGGGTFTARGKQAKERVVYTVLQSPGDD